MNQETFWVLLSKKLSAEASDAELKELESLINANPQWQYAIQNLGDLWNHQPAVDTMQEQDAYMLHLHRMTELNVSFGEYSSVISMPSNNRKKWYWMAAAAVVACVAFFTLSGFFNKQSGQVKASTPLNEVATRQGSKSKVTLPDGSIVWLNAGSKIVYNKEYGQQLREVTLTGEGYFDVIKMADKPFIIHTSNINIKVLGTVFNVKAYPEDKQTETSLIRGSIEVTIKNRPNDKIILSPFEKLVVENEALQLNTTAGEKGILPPAISINKLHYSIADSTVAETQWIDNKLVFNDESFGELAIRMERWYNVEISISDPYLLQKRLTGNFEKETVEQALEALKISIPFKHEQKGNRINIHR